MHTVLPLAFFISRGIKNIIARYACLLSAAYICSQPTHNTYAPIFFEALPPCLFIYTFFTLQSGHRQMRDGRQQIKQVLTARRQLASSPVVRWHDRRRTPGIATMKIFVAMPFVAMTRWPVNTSRTFYSHTRPSLPSRQPARN